MSADSVPPPNVASGGPGGPGGPDAPVAASPAAAPTTEVKMGGRRKKNAWLAHVKATMKSHRNKSFKQVLKIAKKTYKNKSRSKHQSQSQSQSQSSQNGGKKGSKKQQQQGGSGVGGGKEGMAAFGENAAPVA